MTFTSIPYLVFLPVVYLLFRLAAERYRWALLLVASYAFFLYFRAPQVVVALLLETLVCILLGKRIRAAGERGGTLLAAGIAACVAILFAVRYADGIAHLLEPSLGKIPPGFLVTVGVSYFTFQAISYLVDVYLEIVDPEPHAGYLALYLAFFPKLLQGPIERAGDLLPRLRSSLAPADGAFRAGYLLFLNGLFKKVVVANHLALYVDNVFGHITAWNGLALLLGVYGYALQIYFDFSGYTDMARGTARIFGIELTENFNRPYLATSIADFWRRWHISFSRWILDYIFKPLQMATRGLGSPGTAFSLLVTFLVSGLWHGSAGGFLVWGGLHGTYMAASTFYRPWQARLHKRIDPGKSRWFRAWRVFVTFHLVCFSWLFFRAASLSDAFLILGRIARNFELSVYEVYIAITPFTDNNSSICHALVVALLLGYHHLRTRRGEEGLPAGYEVAHILLIVLLGKFTAGSFIYMNF